MGPSVAAQVTGLSAGSGVNETYIYRNDRLQLTRQTATKVGNTLMDLNYSYAASAGASGVGTTAGNSGQLMGITSSPASTINGQNRNQAFTYDDVGRVVTATGWSQWQRRYAYDRWGNRTGVWDATTGGNQIQSVTLQQQPGAPTGVPSNRATTITNNGVPSTQAYDAAGNLTGDGAHSYQYDGEGRLASVDNGAAAYSYDSGNHRLKKVTGGSTTYYVWEGAQVIAEYSNASAGAGGNSYYLADRLSNRMITDSNGAFKGTQDHQPFGEEGGTSGASEKHRFTNYERDNESGSDYAINRQYETANGRFKQPDIVGGSIGDPQSLNRYAYSLNDPVNVVDPIGLSPFDWMTDASIHGPGLYIDGFQILAGQESLFWGLLSSGAGVIAPIGSTAYLGYGGATYISLNTGRSPNGEITLGTLDIQIPDTLTVGALLLNQAINTAITAITTRSSCRDLFVRYIDPVDTLRELRGGRGRGAFRFGRQDANNRNITAGTSAVTTPRFQYQLAGIWRLRNIGVNGAVVSINTGGAFFTGYGNPSRYGATDAVNRAVTILHELGHALDYIYRNEYASGIATYDEDQPGGTTSAANSQLVYNRCFR